MTKTRVPVTTTHVHQTLGLFKTEQEARTALSVNPPAISEEGNTLEVRPSDHNDPDNAWMLVEVYSRTEYVYR
jgi:hypothetical protein